MPKLAFFLLSALAVFSLPSHAAEIGTVSCDALNPNPHIIFKTSYGQLVHDISTPQHQIQAMSSRPEKGILIDGLATATTLGSIRINTAHGIKISDNDYCIIPDEIEVYFGYSNPTIYVAKEYPVAGCRFSLIIRHEQTHQRINILTMQYFLPIIRSAAEKIIRQARSVKISTPTDDRLALALLQRYYAIKLMPIIEKFNLAREQEHQKLDNSTNYAMEYDICNKFEQTTGE